MTPQQIDCAGQVETSDGDRFLSVMTASPDLRGGLFVLYAFHLELARIAWQGGEPMAALIRLQWWHDRVGVSDGTGGGTGGFLAVALDDLVAEGAVSAGDLTAMVVARMTEIQAPPYGDAGALSTHLRDTAGRLMWAAVSACGGGETAMETVMDYGGFAGAAAFLCGVDGMRHAGAEVLGDADLPDFARAALAGLHHAKARLLAGGVAISAYPALRAGWQAEPILRRASRAQPPALSPLGKRMLLIGKVALRKF